MTRRGWGAAALVVVCVGVVWAATTTPRLGLQRPAVGEQNWGVPLNAMIDKVDTYACAPGLACVLDGNVASTDIQLRLVASDCTALTDGVDGEPCYQKATDQLYVCETASPTCSQTEWRLVSGTGGASTTWTLAGDSGTAQTVSNGSTVSVQGSANGIDTVAGTGPNLSIVFDPTEVTNVTWGGGFPTTWIFDAGATDPVLQAINNGLLWTAGQFLLNNQQVATTANALTFTNKNLDGATNDLALRRAATDCTALTDGVDGEPCYEQDADTLYVCEPTAGLCDTASEWRQVAGGGGGGSGDITDVWGCATGNCDALTAASGDTLDAGGATSAKPCKRGTTASLPGSCAEGDCYAATDQATGPHTYWCESGSWKRDVRGPSSATDRAVVAWNGTSGTILQDTACGLTGSALNGIACTTAGAGSLDSFRSTLTSTGAVAVGSYVANVTMADGGGGADTLVGLWIQAAQQSTQVGDQLVGVKIDTPTAAAGGQKKAITVASGWDVGLDLASRASLLVSAATGNGSAQTDNGLAVTYTASDDTDGSDTLTAERIAVTRASDDLNDTVYALRVDAITGGLPTEHAISVGSGWDYGLNMQSPAFIASTITPLNLQKTTTAGGGSVLALTQALATDGAAQSVPVIQVLSAGTADATDTVRGIYLQNTTAQSATQNAIEVGTGWDSGLIIPAGVAASIGGCTFDGNNHFDCGADAALGGTLVVHEGLDDGSNTVTLKVPDTGLSGNATHVFTAAGNLPASAIESAGTVSKCAQFSATGILEPAALACGSGGSGTPGGSTTQVQFNDAGAFGGDAGMTYDKTTDTLTVGAVVTSAADGSRGITLDHNTSNPSAPSANKSMLHVKSDGLYVLPNGSTTPGDRVVTAVTTDTLTGKTLNVEGSGNVITTVERTWIAAAGCNNATAMPLMDLPATNAPAATCVTGTNTQKAYLDFDPTTEESAQVALALPNDFTATGGVDVRFKWLTAANSGSVVWAVQTICVADAELDDPAWNTKSTVTDVAKTTPSQTNDATITGVTITGCAAGELLHLRVFRDATNGADSVNTNDARLIGVELTYRRAQ